MSEWGQASHSHRTWAQASSSAPHLLHKGLLIGPIMYRYLLRVLCPVWRPVATLDCVLSNDGSLVFAVRLGPEINFWACLWVLIRPCHMLHVHPAFYLFSYILPRDPQGQFRSSKLVNSSLFGELVGNSISTYLECPGPRTVAQNASWTCYSMSFGNVVCCFGSLKGFHSHLNARANTNVYLWSNNHTNFIYTGQDSIHLGLENSSIFS